MAVIVVRVSCAEDRGTMLLLATRYDIKQVVMGLLSIPATAVERTFITRVIAGRLPAFFGGLPCSAGSDVLKHVYGGDGGALVTAIRAVYEAASDNEGTGT